MKKITYLIAALIINYVAYSQSEYGILFISDIEARDELQQTDGIHQIQFDNNDYFFYPNPFFTPVLGKEDFFYMSPNLTTKKITLLFDSYHRGCFINQNIEFDIKNYNNGGLTGCFATTNFYLIHTTPTNTSDFNKCPDDTIELTNGWNWQYSFDGTNWLDFAANFQEQRGISFKIKELAGFENKTKIYFRTGYKTQFTNILPYDISPCTPKITQISSQNLTSCSYSKDGAVTFTFERELQNEEQYEMTLMFENNAAVPDGNKTITKHLMTTPKTYTWTNLPAENYKLTYYTKKTVGSKEYLSNPPGKKNFTISSPPKLEFTVSANNPLCNNGATNLIIEAIGGSPPYFYDDLEGTTEFINGETKIKRIQFNPSDEKSNKVSIPLQNPKSVYNIKVTDANYCIDTNAKD